MPHKSDYNVPSDANAALVSNRMYLADTPEKQQALKDSLANVGGMDAVGAALGKVPPGSGVNAQTIGGQAAQAVGGRPNGMQVGMPRDPGRGGNVGIQAGQFAGAAPAAGQAIGQFAGGIQGAYPGGPGEQAAIMQAMQQQGGIGAGPVGQAAAQLAGGRSPSGMGGPQAAGAIGAAAGQFGAQPSQGQTAGQAIGALAATKQPTLQNYLAGQFRNDPSAKPKFTDPSAAKLSKIDVNGIIKDKFKNLKDVSEGERAYRGSMMGAAIGSSLYGPVGALIGTTMGSTAARAIGAQQSGEAEDTKRRVKLGEMLSTMGVVGKKGTIDFDDGASFAIDALGAQTLKNVGTAPGNRSTRKQFEIDPTNPFANRTMAAVRPVARFIANGLMNHPVDKDPRNQKIVDNITGYLSNAVQQDADSATTIYARTKTIIDKMGIKEVDLRSYLESIKGSLDEQELKEMIAGMDKLFPGVPQGAQRA